ncbi:DUF5131 family protein [Nocardia asiatica]|uniref:DUF5131 family protein n=1 Tax=Nocardia asiatica TaxID=209252 RepID=UPI002458141D|nr:phage Gp37/Gp68 family protein [Nocardia asiatica]
MTRIEWTEETWNPVTGCTRVSAGCLNCYIERTLPMRMAHRRFDGPGIGATLPVQLHPERLDQPLKWRAPRRVFVNSMSDLFHDDVPGEFIARVFATMARAEQHTFQVLTKRPGRMRSLVSDGGQRLLEHTTDEATATALYDGPWPLPNVWLGVSAENQETADLRIPKLLDTPAAVRFISAEPLLGPIDLNDAPADWVIVGGESGPGARPMHPSWAQSLQDQCEQLGIAFFFKQWGEWTGQAAADSPWHHRQCDGWVDERDGRVLSETDALADGGSFTGVWRVGKKASGRLLDGRTWDEFPQAMEVP